MKTAVSGARKVYQVSVLFLMMIAYMIVLSVGTVVKMVEGQLTKGSQWLTGHVKSAPSTPASRLPSQKRP